MSEVQIDEGLIRFFIYSEKRMVDGVFPYSEFVNYMMKEKGAKLFDTQHMIVPNVSKKEIEVYEEVTIKDIINEDIDTENIKKVVEWFSVGRNATTPTLMR